MDEKGKEQHHKLIMKALAIKNMNALQIAESCGLTQHQVSRRTSELIALNKIKAVGTMLVNRNGILRKFTIYEMDKINQ